MENIIFIIFVCQVPIIYHAKNSLDIYLTGDRLMNEMYIKNERAAHRDERERVKEE